MSKLSFNDLINSPTPTLVDFYADWCQPCKIMAPVLEQYAEKHQDKIKVIKINTDNNQAVSAKYGIQSIPTLILFKNGNVVWRKSGALPINVLENELSNFLN